MIPKRNRSLVARLRWAILPMTGYTAYPDSWRDTARGVPFVYLDRALARLPRSDLFEPYRSPPCSCAYCRGLTDKWEA